MRDRELKLTRRCEDVLTRTRPAGAAALWCGVSPSGALPTDAVWLRYAAMGQAASALPALKPNQPNQSRPVPMST